MPHLEQLKHPPRNELICGMGRIQIKQNRCGRKGSKTQMTQVKLWEEDIVI